MSSTTTLPEFPSFVTHLDCAYAGEQFEPDRLCGLSPAGKPLSVMYNLDEGLVSPGEQAVPFNCSSGLKYPMPPAERRIDHTQSIDWDALVAA